jgi:hypothetical protein
MDRLDRFTPWREHGVEAEASSTWANIANRRENGHFLKGSETTPGEGQEASEKSPNHTVSLRVLSSSGGARVGRRGRRLVRETAELALGQP